MAQLSLPKLNFANCCRTAGRFWAVLQFLTRFSGDYVAHHLKLVFCRPVTSLLLLRHRAAVACQVGICSVTMAATKRAFPLLLSELDLGFTKLRNRVLMGSSTCAA